jgi:hypothetical protein
MPTPSEKQAGLSPAFPDTVEPKSYRKRFHLSERFRIPDDKFHDICPFRDIFAGKRLSSFKFPLFGVAAHRLLKQVIVTPSD